ncbi:hypothetical protein [Streptomyces phaeochromogenes]|uniref:hypothetical protein n=1 Tax=Streptomyces phaeochromogenes TaxID=1923 RepID=UPI002DDAC9D4|nr:hypothetical protein [Streptomyces phaeochromogenes]WRZ29994.1 hypothetical protein OG931_20695 [Streptomyces phaeochromogenes]
MNVPTWLLRHRVSVEPYLGESAYGPRFGPTIEDVPALVSEEIKQVRDRTGTQTISTAQVIAAPDLNCPAGSRLTLPDRRTTRALSVAHHTAPGLPVPQCTEVMCE